jgi:hypothetical protein
MSTVSKEAASCRIIDATLALPARIAEPATDEVQTLKQMMDTRSSAVAADVAEVPWQERHAQRGAWAGVIVVHASCWRIATGSGVRRDYHSSFSGRRRQTEQGLYCAQTLKPCTIASGDAASCAHGGGGGHAGLRMPRHPTIPCCNGRPRPCTEGDANALPNVVASSGAMCNNQEQGQVSLCKPWDPPVPGWIRARARASEVMLAASLGSSLSC